MELGETRRNRPFARLREAQTLTFRRPVLIADPQPARRTYPRRRRSPARLFLRFVTDRGEKRAMEVIWGNRLKPGDYKYIGSFPHFVADAGDERVGYWLDERIDLARIGIFD
jgi:hypothetical protein